jgi:hypothetical protein
MPKKRHGPEEIVGKRRQVDVMTSQGRSLAEAIRSIGVAEATLPPLAQRVRRAQARSGAAPEGA